MSRNIKEIGKELLGKSLNSYHRRTGLTQLEKNNNIQDGILDGILSQVDGAYIEKTEQSNVIHLEGSGDGVVVLDGIEGNTMVNLATMDNWREGKSSDTHRKVTITSPTSWKKVYKYFHLKPNTIYTIFIKITNNSDATTGKMYIRYVHNQNATTADGAIGNGQTGVFNKKITLDNTGLLCLTCESGVMTGDIIFEDLLLLEGDWTNKEMPTYFEGLQSSFEEKVNSDNKHEIEILSNNKNLYNVEDVNIDNWMNSGGVTVSKINNNIVFNGTVSNYFDFRTVQNSWNTNLTKLINKLPAGIVLTMSNNLTNEKNTINYWSVRRDGVIKYFTNTLTIQKGDTEISGFVRFKNGTVLNNTILKVQIEINNKATNYTMSKQNKIKLLINEPLRGIGNTKDRLCVKDNKLVIERKCAEEVFDGSNSVGLVSEFTTTNRYSLRSTYKYKTASTALSDKFPSNNTNDDFEHIRYDGSTPYSTSLQLYINKNKLASSSVTEVKKYLQSNPMRVIGVLAEPFYEEVLNEYGEPIILEGYENGTIYIDSTIVPTTTLRYTPKMESLKTLKAVNDNNIMLINDINESIIPYMMEIDFMIMEKEMATMSHNNNNNIRIIGEKSMTSMQKRTKEMLERLIKGKSLTKEDAKTRVTVYLNAGKITDEQAEELMLTIEEVYA